MSNLYTLRESEFYAWQLSKLGTTERMDDVLTGCGPAQGWRTIFHW